MANPTFVQKATATSGVSHTQTQAVTITSVVAGHTLVLIAGSENSGGNNGTSATVTGDTNGTWGAAVKNVPSANGPDPSGITAWVLTNANAGTHVITVDFTTDEAFAWLEVLEYTASVFDVGGTATTADHSSTTLSATTGTLSKATEMVVAAIAVSGGAGSTNLAITDPPTGFTSRQVYNNSSTSMAGEVADVITSATTAQTPVWTWAAGASAAAVVISLKTPGNDTILTAAKGTFSITPFTTNLNYHRPATVLTAAQGTYTITGQAAGLRKGKTVTAAFGAFSVTGQTTNLTYASHAPKTLVAGTGVFNLTFGGVFSDNTVNAAKGTFAITGQTTNLTYHPSSVTNVLTAAKGTFSVTGQTTLLTYHASSVARTLTAAQGTYTITGQSTSLTYFAHGTTAYRLTAGMGTYNATGQNVRLLFNHPASAPSAGQWFWRNPKVFEVTKTSKTQWVDYIPIQYVTVSSSEINRTDDVGAIGVTVLASNAGLVAWVDYTPVAQVSQPIILQWRYDDTGYIPVYRLN